MFAPIFSVCKASAAVNALLTSANVTRIYLFGEVPEGVIKPYVVWNTLTGSPENYLSGASDVDEFDLQIDVFADAATAARNTAKAVMDAIEPYAYVTRYGGEGRDPATKLSRYSFDVSWTVTR